VRTPGELERRILGLVADLPAENGAAVAEEAPRLARFLEQLLKANERMNLVSAAAAQPEELVRRHLFDALLGLALLPRPRAGGLRLLDVGSGGGLPAVPLLILRGDLQGTLVESTKKKSRFLEATVRALSLTAEVVNARFPTGVARRPEFYDVLTTRAVASAGRLVRAARPFLAPSGTALIWTTSDLLDEIRRESGRGDLTFEKSPAAEKRGIAVLRAAGR
jgi:16S rRNA (guanine527-N7)-methyltransferase